MRKTESIREPWRGRGPKTDGVIQWLIEGDPAIRWQTLRDLVGAPERSVAMERAKVASAGWGARLLARQDTKGTWAGGPTPDHGLYTPKWISTTYTMLTLRDLGLPAENPHAKKACRILLDRGLRSDGGISYGTWADWTDRGETCVTGMVLSILSYFHFDAARLHPVAEHLLEQQMPDGGWNCRRPQGATHSSVHTTISVLEGLRHYELHCGHSNRKIPKAQQRGREFLLMHRLFRSDRTGEIIKSEFLRFVFPPRWHYDILRALDYFQSANAPRDSRMAEAIVIVRERQRSDGKWLLQHRYSGKTWFEFEKIGTASRWNTLRALRVLKWWDR